MTFEETDAQEEETFEWANRNMISVAWLTPTQNPFPPPIGKAAARFSQRKQLLRGAPGAAACP